MNERKRRTQLSEQLSTMVLTAQREIGICIENLRKSLEAYKKYETRKESRCKTVDKDKSYMDCYIFLYNSLNKYIKEQQEADLKEHEVIIPTTLPTAWLGKRTNMTAAAARL